jgi:hypothetical protein
MLMHLQTGKHMLMHETPTIQSVPLNSSSYMCGVVRVEHHYARIIASKVRIKKLRRGFRFRKEKKMKRRPLQRRAQYLTNKH